MFIAASNQRKIFPHQRKKRLDPLRPSTVRPSPWSKIVVA
jgi:hypothetical protein